MNVSMDTWSDATCHMINLQKIKLNKIKSESGAKLIIHIPLAGNGLVVYLLLITGHNDVHTINLYPL